MSAEPGPRWSLTREAFDRLLSRMSGESEAAAREYESIRRRLLVFFEMRGIPASECLADETIDRVARKLEEGEAIQHLRAYFSGVAQRIVLEWERGRARERAAALEAQSRLPVPDGTLESREARVACLKRCLRALPRESRELIVSYYRNGGGFDLEGRQALADRLGISYTSLKARVHRVRGRVEACLRECLRIQSLGDR